MGTFLNPGGSNAFTELAAKQDSCIFVDKTDFISETIDRLDAGDLKLIAFTRTCTPECIVRAKFPH